MCHLPVWELNILKSIREGSESDPLKVLDFRHHNRSVGSENDWLDGTLNSTVLWWKKNMMSFEAIYQVYSLAEIETHL